MEAITIPKPNQDSTDENKAEKLEKKIFQSILGSKMEDIGINLEGLNNIFTHVEELFGNQAWIGEIKRDIEKDIELDSIKKRIKKYEDRFLDQQIKHIEEKVVKSVIKSLEKAGVSARKEESYDKAIKILQDIDTKLLPSIATFLSTKERQGIKTSLLEELKTTFIKKGEINEAIKVIDTCCTQDDFKSDEFIKSQIDKSFLLIQKGEFNQAANLLKKTLKNEKTLPPHKRKLKDSAEIKRVLGITYRGQGAYQEAIKWFNEARDEFHQANDEMSYHHCLWGIGILRHMTGEWEEAIEIWEKLLSFFKKDSDSSLKFKKPLPILRVKVYTDYSRTLQISGRYLEAEKILTKALELINQNFQYEYVERYQAYIHLEFSNLYFQQEKIKKAHQAINEVRKINEHIRSQQKETLREIKILKTEINVLIALNKAEEARQKLLDQYDNLKSNWEKATYFYLLGIIEKSEMNFGLAKKAFRSSLEKTKEIGASTLSDELVYVSLLVDMSRTGSKKAYTEAKLYLTKLETEILEKKLPAFSLECNLLKARLAHNHSNYDEAYQLYSKVIADADTYRLFRQKNKALKGINLIEHEGQQLRTEKVREMSVYRYLDDARRILEENS